MEIKTEINIKASPEDVWKVLTDFANYPNWNPFIKWIKGEVAEGKQIEARIVDMTFKPKVLVFRENREFKWLGKLFIKGLFDGEHKFEMIENEDGSTKFLHSERFGGILVPVFRKKLLIKTLNGFEEMNRALKKRVEE